MAATTDVPREALASTPLLSALSDEQLARVLASARVRRLEDGERLFDFGQPARHFFFVGSGEIKLFRNSADGGEKVIEVIRAGQLFAEAVMFMGAAKPVYPVSAQAIFATEVVAIENATMLDLLRDSTELCFRMMASLSRRLHSLVDEIDRLTLHNATFRFVFYLLQQIPEGIAEAPEVVLTTPKNVIASKLGIQPETFSRIEARLVRDGLVAIHGPNIVLRDLEGLRALVEL